MLGNSFAAREVLQMSDSTDTKSLAGRLRWAREQAGLSQGQVALKLGMHRPTISQIEAGDRKVRIDEVASFATLYSVKEDWILKGEISLPGKQDPRVELAARELSKLKREDLDTILRLIQVLRSNTEERK